MQSSCNGQQSFLGLRDMHRAAPVGILALGNSPLLPVAPSFTLTTVICFLCSGCQRSLHVDVCEEPPNYILRSFPRRPPSPMVPPRNTEKMQGTCTSRSHRIPLHKTIRNFCGGPHSPGFEETAKAVTSVEEVVNDAGRGRRGKDFLLAGVTPVCSELLHLQLSAHPQSPELFEPYYWLPLAARPIHVDVSAPSHGPGTSVLVIASAVGQPL